MDTTLNSSNYANIIFWRIEESGKPYLFGHVPFSCALCELFNDQIDKRTKVTAHIFQRTEVFSIFLKIIARQMNWPGRFSMSAIQRNYSVKPFLLSSSTIFLKPFSCAICRAVSPYMFFTSARAPLSTSTCTTSH